MTKVFIATANQDKFNRISRWFTDLAVELYSPNDLPADLAEQTKVTDAEEKSFGTMAQRALAKASKAARALQGQHYVVIAMDDTAYLPLFDSEVNDLRTPPAMYMQGKLIAPAVTERLSGIDLANHYAKLTDLAVGTMTDEMAKLGYKYMPIVWRFAVALANQTSDARIIANWERKQYLRNTLLTEAVSDTGYMMDRIISSTPDGAVQVYGKGIGIEEAPTSAVQGIFGKA